MVRPVELSGTELQTTSGTRALHTPLVREIYRTNNQPVR